MTDNVESQLCAVAVSGRIDFYGAITARIEKRLDRRPDVLGVMVSPVLREATADRKVPCPPKG